MDNRLELTPEERLNVRERFGSDELDRIFIYFMRTILRMEKKGITALPVENDLRAEPSRSYLDLAVRMITDAQPPEVARMILESQYDFIVSNSQLTEAVAMQMLLIEELSLHVHYDKDPSAFLLSTGNLWGNAANEFACRTFYPNFSGEWQREHYVFEVMQNIPEGMLRRDDY